MMVELHAVGFGPHLTSAVHTNPSEKAVQVLWHLSAIVCPVSEDLSDRETVIRSNADLMVTTRDVLCCAYTM